MVVFSGESLDRIRRIAKVKGFACDLWPSIYKLDPLFGLLVRQLVSAVPVAGNRREA